MKNKFKIVIGSFDMLKKFLQICNTFEEDIDIQSGRYIIDAKSAMALLSLDVTREMMISIHSTNQRSIERFNKELESYKS